jgi:hypothetical protein
MNRGGELGKTDAASREGLAKPLRPANGRRDRRKFSERPLGTGYISISIEEPLTRCGRLEIIRLMLKASRNPRAGLRADSTYQVTDPDSGHEIAMINETRLSIDLGQHSFSVYRKGFPRPEYQLKSGDTIVATASQKPFFNHYELVRDGKEWTFRKGCWGQVRYQRSFDFSRPFRRCICGSLFWE